MEPICPIHISALAKSASPAEERARAWLSEVAEAAGSTRKLAFAVWGEGNEAARSKLTKVISGGIKTVDVQLVEDVEAYAKAHLPHLARGQNDGGHGTPPAPNPASGPAAEGPDPDDPNAFVEVPQYGHVGAGDARVPPQSVGVLRVTPAEYAHDFGEPPRVIGDRYRPSGRFGYFIIDGDSAVPVFFDRERVPVQFVGDERTFANDLLYVFRWAGEYQIKRLRLVRAPKEGQAALVRATSLNPGIDPFEFELAEDEDFAVVALARMGHKQQLYTALVGRFFREQF